MGSFHFQFEGHDVDIEDVPLGKYADIETKTSVRWFDLQRSPLRHAAAGEMLAKACAEIAGVTLPDPLTPRVFVELFKLIEDDNLPIYEDGIPDPKAGDTEPETN